MSCNGDCQQGRTCNCKCKMTKQTEALRMAIEALEMSNELVSHGLIDFEKYNITENKDIYIKILSAIDACKESLND